MKNQTARDLFEYVKTTKNFFPYSNIKIVTNGILLLTMNDDFFNEIRRYNIEICISVYPPVKKMLAKIEEKLTKESITYNVFRVGDIFNKILTSTKNENIKEIANACEKCTIMYNGLISRCAPSIFINIFNKKFNENFPNENKLVEEFSNSKELFYHLNSPKKLCDFCTGDYDQIGFKWENGNLVKEDKNDYIR